MNSLKDIFKSKIASWIAMAFVACYIIIYLVKDPSTMPMDNLQNIIMIVIGYYFGSSDKSDDKKDK